MVTPREEVPGVTREEYIAEIAKVDMLLGVTFDAQQMFVWAAAGVGPVMAAAMLRRAADAIDSDPIRQPHGD